MVDKRAEGAVGEPFELIVERGKIAEFARSVGANHADHVTAEVPVAPATFLTTMFHWERLVADSNPWHLVQMSKQRGMQASQRYVFHGAPPRAGDRLTCTSRIDRMWDKQGRRGGNMTFVEMVTEFRNEAGELIAEAFMRAVEPEQAAQKSAPDDGGKA